MTKKTPDLNTELEVFVQKFNPIFEQEVLRLLEQNKEYSAGHTEDLDEDFKKITLRYTQGGKRVRPFFVQLFSGLPITDPNVQKICLSIELFHLAALIHDDIMDKAATRRGAATIHSYGKSKRISQDNFGESIALMYGDLFLVGSLEILEGLSLETKKILFTMQKKTIRGQILDVFSANKGLGGVSREEVLARHRLKTADYTFVSPAASGFSLSGIKDPSTEHAISNCMRRLGLLFQVRDDVLDAQGSTGKPKYGDILSGQTTWLSCFLEKNHPVAYEKCIVAWKTQSIEGLDEMFANIDLNTAYTVEYDEVKKHLQDHCARTKSSVDFMEILKLLRL